MASINQIVAAVAMLAVAATAYAGDDSDCKSGHLGPKTHCGRFVHCPHCNHTCSLSIGKDKETKHCFDVECKPICIPRVTFPWQRSACCDQGGKGSCGDCGKSGCGGGHNGAKTKSVRVLKKYEYECPKCKYTWTPDVKYSDSHIKKDIEPVDVRSDEAPVPEPPAIEARRTHGLPVIR